MAREHPYSLMRSYALLTTEIIELKGDSKVIEEKINHLRNTMNIISDIITNYFGNGIDYSKIKTKDIEKAVEIFQEYQKKLYDNGFKIQTNTIQDGPAHMEIVEKMIKICNSQNFEKQKITFCQL